MRNAGNQTVFPVFSRRNAKKAAFAAMQKKHTFLFYTNIAKTEKHATL
jgi:hypothetical protein